MKNNKSNNIELLLVKNGMDKEDLSYSANIDIDKLELYLNGEFGNIDDFLNIKQALNCGLRDIVNTKDYFKWQYETNLNNSMFFTKDDIDVSFVMRLCNFIGSYYEFFRHNNYDINIKKYGNVENHWNFITAILDRIRDSAAYIKFYNPKHYKGSKIAFGFYDLIGHVYNLNSYINDFHDYFNIKYKKILSDDHLFFSQLIGRDGSDDDFIKYLRALVYSNHSISTIAHKFYIEKGDIHISPFALWENKKINDKLYDVNVLLRTNTKSIYDFYISTSEVYKFIQCKLYSLIFVLEALENKSEDRINELRKTKIKTLDEFSSLSNYINYLKDEHDIRIGNNVTEIYEFYAKLFDNEWPLKDGFYDFVQDYKKEIEEEIHKRAKYLSSLLEEDYNKRFEDLYIIHSKFIEDHKLGYETSHLTFNYDVFYSQSSRINAYQIIKTIDNNNHNYYGYTDEELFIIVCSLLYKVSKLN